MTDKKVVERNKLTRLMIPMNLSFFDGEKTEKPTAKKKSDARNKGQVANSQEVGIAALLIAVFVALRMFSGGMFDRLVGVFKNSFVMISDFDRYFEVESYVGVIVDAFAQVLLTALPIFAIAMVSGIVVNVLQVGWKITTEPMRPKFSKLSPLKGVKRLFSKQALVNLLKALLKIGLIGVVVYNSMMARQNDVVKLASAELAVSFVYVADLACSLGLQVGFTYLVIAAVDYAYTRWNHTKELKMSKNEVKDEYKQQEGDPQVKGKIRRKMLEAGMRRMMQAVPQADVIITNPTHFAIALKYDAEAGTGAPVVTAKGCDHLAFRIREKAKEARVPIVENKPLARALYASVDVGKEIPPELYTAVIEILLYVYNKNGKLDKMRKQA